MTATTFFDTHGAIKRLIAAGCTEEQAETEVQLQVKAFISLHSEQTTIKQDLHALKTTTDKFKTDVEHEFVLVRQKMNEKFNYLDMKFTGKFNLLYWMMGVLITILSPLLITEVTHIYSLLVFR